MITEFNVPTPGGRPWGITAGPDGALWFTEFQGNQIGRITTGVVQTPAAVPTLSFPMLALLALALAGSAVFALRRL